jgi:hypothetical protein
MGIAWIVRPLPIAAATASGTTLGAATNVGNDFAGIVWRGPSATSTTLTVDFGADVAIDTLMLFGVGAVSGTVPTMQVSAATAAQGNFTGSFWSDTAAPLYAGSVAPVSGKRVAVWAAPAGAPASFRYMRLTFARASAVTIELARLAAGARISLERNFNAINLGVRDLSSLDFSARGVLLRRRAKKLRTLALSFSNLLKSEVEASVKPLLEQVGNSEMVAMLTDPDADAQRENRAYFGPLVGDLSVAWRRADRWESKTNLVSIF